MTADFSGIKEKLKRADENILNLESEVSGFFQECKYPVLPKIQDKEHAEAVEYFKKLTIPLRFSVLSGEIVHHLRSCLDHIIWEFSNDAVRTSKDAKFLEFPILKEGPTAENKFTSYDRKIQGVTNVAALKLIDKFQPYHRSDPVINPLYLINNVDIIDKHRELVITHSTGRMEGPLPLMTEMSAYLSKRLPMSPELKGQFDQYGQITPQISFKDLRGREAESIIPTLTELSSYVALVVDEFDNFII